MGNFVNLSDGNSRKKVDVYHAIAMLPAEVNCIRGSILPSRYPWSSLHGRVVKELFIQKLFNNVKNITNVNLQKVCSLSEYVLSLSPTYYTVVGHIFRH